MPDNALGSATESLRQLHDKVQVKRAEGALYGNRINLTSSQEDSTIEPGGIYHASKILREVNNQQLATYGETLFECYNKFHNTLNTSRTGDFEEREGGLYELDRAYEEAKDTGLINEEVWQDANKKLEGTHRILGASSEEIADALEDTGQKDPEDNE